MKLYREHLAKEIATEAPHKISQVTSNEEFVTFLELKLSEDLSLLKSAGYHGAENFADVLEVLDTLAAQHGISFEELLMEKHKQQKNRGDLKRGLICNRKRKENN